MRALMSATFALFVLTVNAQALDDARRRVIEEACPAYEREEMGPNGVMSPREVRCRLSMGESYEEIDADIKTLQAREAQRQRLGAEANAQARERATRDRDRAQQVAPDLCRRMVQEHKEGRWFTSRATAPALLSDDAKDPERVEVGSIAGVTRFMDALGHNYSEPDQRALVLSATSDARMKQFASFDDLLGRIGANIRARAQRAQFYEETARNSGSVVQRAPSSNDYAFKCFLEQRFGSLSADPFDRAVKLDASGRYIGQR